jgi:hypothetical protein
LLWQKPFLFGSKASPLFGGGFYIKENDRIQINRLRRYSENGDLVFEVKFPVSMTQITNAIQTTSDNGVVILTNEGLIKYSLDGTLSYSNSLIANNIISLNNNSFGIYDNISFKKINLSNGSIMWNYDLADIKSVKVLNDGGIVLLTASNLTKLDINGNLIWTTNYGGQSMVNFESNEVAVANQNVLTKLNPNGTLKWQKTFSPSILPYYGLNIFKASDEGMFVITHIATFNGTGNTPLAYLMKLSKDGNYCNYTSSINSNGTDICGTAKPLIARFNNKPLTDFPAPNFPIVPTTNFQLQWKKDGVVVGNNATFNAIDSGNYTFEIINGGCTVSSLPVSLTRLPANTTLSGIKTTNEIYKAETINSTQMIQPPVKVDYLAGRSVVLEAGFESKPNTVFMAKITGCN